MSVIKAVKEAHGAAMTMESPGEGSLPCVQLRPLRTGETCLGQYGDHWEPPKVACSVDGEG